MHAQILVIDFGSQFAHLISRRVRDLAVSADVVPSTIAADEVATRKPRGIILSGGPASIYEEGAPGMDENILDLGIPVLGLCYGHQLMAHLTGGSVRAGDKREYGLATLRKTKDSQLLKGIGEQEQVWMNHGDIVGQLGQGFVATGATQNCGNACYEHQGRNLYGCQFHPEVTHTLCGSMIFSNFLRICKTEQDFGMKNIAEQAIAELAGKLNGRKAVIGLSGGVDSMTAAVLAAKAAPEQITAIFVDTGFMREGEAQEVRDAMAPLGLDVHIVDARTRFYQGLKGIIDPEEKRKAIGRMFIEVFREHAKGARVLIQGTIYPDRIESGGSAHASKIKSHHNVGGLPENVGMDIVEPLRELYKDEVRRLALQLGCPDELVWRHPFPGPGLAVRILGEATEERAAIVARANAILEEEMHGADLYKDIWQGFCVLLPISSVGVQGDARSYKQVIGIRLVKSTDAMTAEFAKVPWDFLEQVSTRITNEMTQVNRVVYDITHKPPATIEWE
ncbi:glutamine-hydrolyzing GMP synthase [Candidatus Woesearchaeota archaeon CG1_02_57_44]|nr:MAG: glutamine-hydrolyzing GMP synthase [Candidatus Woesearchaeota archaeon CG1_02_57_44]PIN70757.1 MAG: glutamine-hydrolyzing GMP synthase [Candidatus Woesearchaeota archaeon CG11_big_fil_rev_8_21_14_0_20_57_5]